jgi:hypothetical protein
MFEIDRQNSDDLDTQSGQYLRAKLLETKARWVVIKLHHSLLICPVRGFIVALRVVCPMREATHHSLVQWHCYCPS